MFRNNDPQFLIQSTIGPIIHGLIWSYSESDIVSNPSSILTDILSIEMYTSARADLSSQWYQAWQFACYALFSVQSAQSRIYLQNYTNYSPQLKAGLSASPLWVNYPDQTWSRYSDSKYQISRCCPPQQWEVRWSNSGPRNPQHKVEEKQVVR